MLYFLVAINLKSPSECSLEGRKAATVRMTPFLAWKDVSVQVDSEQLSHWQFSAPKSDLRRTIIKVLVGKCILQAPFMSENAVKGSISDISTNCIFLFYFIASFFPALLSVFFFCCLADFFKNIWELLMQCCAIALLAAWHCSSVPVLDLSYRWNILRKHESETSNCDPFSWAFLAHPPYPYSWMLNIFCSFTWSLIRAFFFAFSWGTMRKLLQNRYKRSKT